MDIHHMLCNILLQTQIQLVEQYIACYQCHKRRSVRSQSMRQMSHFPNLGILLSQFSFPSLHQTFCKCDRMWFFATSGAIWTIQWFLVHWRISSTQSSCNWVLVECLKILSKKKVLFRNLVPRSLRYIFSFMVNEHLFADIKGLKCATP